LDCTDADFDSAFDDLPTDPGLFEFLDDFSFVLCSLVVFPLTILSTAALNLDGRWSAVVATCVMGIDEFGSLCTGLGLSGFDVVVDEDS
jgi:hypothetical protein